MGALATSESTVEAPTGRRLFGLLGVVAFVLLELAWVAVLIRLAMLLV